MNEHATIILFFVGLIIGIISSWHFAYQRGYLQSMQDDQFRRIEDGFEEDTELMARLDERIKQSFNNNKYERSN